MTEQMPPSPIESLEETVEEAVEEIKDAVEEAVTELHLSDSDKSEIADMVYQKVNKLIHDIVEAAEDAAEILTDTALSEAPPAEAPAAEEPAATEEEAEEDVKPKQGHKLFKKPFKKDK